MNAFINRVPVWKGSTDFAVAASLFTSSVLLHLLPFLARGAHPLGYDTGFYRRYLIEPITSFPNAPVPGLGDDALFFRTILDLLRALGLPPDIVLYGTLIACFAAVPALLFYYLRPHVGVRGAFLAGISIIFSGVAYNAFWFMLLKNAFALCLLLLALIAFERRALAALFVIDIALAASHKTSAVLYVVLLAILMLLARGRRRELVLHICLSGSVLLALNLPSVREAFFTLPAAVFIDWSQFLTLSAPFLLVILAGFALKTRLKLPQTLIAFGGAAFLFPLFQLPFYERMFVFADIALAAGAGIAADILLSCAREKEHRRTRYFAGAVLCVSGGLLLGNLWNQLVTLTPLIDGASLHEIERIGMIVPREATILTSTDEAPWYEGFTNAHIAAPGLLHDRHPLPSWVAVWNATSTGLQTALLKSYPSPLYISTLGEVEDLIGALAPCVVKITTHLYRSDCGSL